MLKTAPILLLLIVVWALGSTLALAQSHLTPPTGQGGDAPTLGSGTTEYTLATVNGIQLGVADVRFAIGRGGHGKQLTVQHRKNVIEGIIGRELIRQRAVDLGLDASPRYQEKLRRMQAQINAFKRKELSELFWRETARSVEVSDADARKYFDENTETIRTELHVMQILSRVEDSVGGDLAKIEKGASFEEVAGKRFAKLPKGRSAPWDLGYLRWKQVPQSWHSTVYSLKNGEVSNVIQGPNKRFWIIKLVDKRINEGITFESIKPTIMEDLRSAKIEELRSQIARDLRGKASIVYSISSAEILDEEE